MNLGSVLSLRGPALRAVAEPGIWGAEHVLKQVGSLDAFELRLQLNPQVQ